MGRSREFVLCCVWRDSAYVEGFADTPMFFSHSGSSRMPPSNKTHIIIRLSGIFLYSLSCQTSLCIISSLTTPTLSSTKSLSRLIFIAF